MNINVNAINQNNNYFSRLNPPKIKREYSALQIPSTIAGTGDMGKLIPITIRDLIPGQKVKINHQTAIQFMPFVSNLFHEIECEIYNYFVPYRLIGGTYQNGEEVLNRWEEYITGGKDGMNGEGPLYTFDVEKLSATPEDNVHTLWDYFGLQLQVPEDGRDTFNENNDVNAWPWLAYNKIYNDHIRIIDFEDAIEGRSNKVQEANWNWDYFTRARIFQQRGVTPSIPLSQAGTKPAKLFHEIQTGSWSNEYLETGWEQSKQPYSGALVEYDGTNGRTLSRTHSSYENEEYIYNKDTMQAYEANEEDLVDQEPKGQIRVMPHELTTENLSNIGVNLNDFLINLGIARFQINNSKIEPRYIDHLRYRWGVFPEDARLQRSEYLGSESFKVMTEIVTQTAPGDTTKQGHITGQAWASSQNKTIEYDVKEHGLFMAILCIRPKSVYEGGIPAWLSRRNKFDYATPELANLPDVEIKKRELKWTATDTDKETFGWRGIYEEYRTEYNKVVGMLRPSINAGFGSYTLARYFEEQPELNTNFLKCRPDKERIMQYPDEPTFMFFNRTTFRTALPLPLQSEPAELANI